LIQEPGEGARPIEDKRAELAALPPIQPLSSEEVALIGKLGDNTGCMSLKGATPDHDGAELADRWSLHERHFEVAERWQIDPEVAPRAHVAAAASSRR
jgi:hypothetical protein